MAWIVRVSVRPCADSVLLWYFQTIGITLGTICAPLLENLFLFAYEYDYLVQLAKPDTHQARNFQLCHRYDNDLLIDSNKTFMKHVDRIYPEELVLKQTTESPTGDCWMCFFPSITKGRLPELLRNMTSSTSI
jgi:hypothetical protein